MTYLRYVVKHRPASLLKQRPVQLRCPGGHGLPAQFLPVQVQRIGQAGDAVEIEAAVAALDHRHAVGGDAAGIGHLALAFAEFLPAAAD